MANLISWFEIPAQDLTRAALFYGKVLNAEVPVQSFGGFKIAFLPGDEQHSTGALVQHEVYIPSHQGVLIYLNGGSDLSEMLDRVEPAGGKVLKPKSMVSADFGYMAVFEDSEGNRVALHSKN
jgi:predicted enzyme related to lactoylglutathione lyase